MDYEKKYNEALERFKTFREKYCTYGDLHFGDGGQWKSGFCVGEKGFLNIARHFYELGKNSK